MQATLAEVELSLLRLPADEAPDDAIEVARALSDDELREWTALSDRLLARPSFMERLSPSRWIASWRRRQLFKQERSEEHTSELQSLMRNSYAVFCLKKKKQNRPQQQN